MSGTQVTLLLWTQAGELHVDVVYEPSTAPVDRLVRRVVAFFAGRRGGERSGLVDQWWPACDVGELVIVREDAPAPAVAP